ncbi:uncharacterized protein LOC133792064 [Humulus lupulus]|uniref:uncharacterized protein LOC133792064 n=1 Tax=Humulus lupulus TaxID=3486 RepID=UPI002B40091D|nr:uncharacterized protein LOC133792064 [Humulus lupulus]
MWFVGKKPFRYFSMWKDAVNFDAKIAKSWQEGVVGTDMFKLTVKLKRLKQVLKSINKEGFNDLQKKEMLAKEVLLELQGKVNTDPLNSKLLLEEQATREQYTKIYKAYSLFLAQKAKTSWAKNGDENTAIFHASLRQLLGSTMSQRSQVNQSIIDLGPKISDMHLNLLQADFTAQEVKEAIFSIPGMKSPGPDGFGSSFYQDNWNLVGAEVEAAVLSFLNSGKLLKEINATTITIIPKSSCPRSLHQK